MKFIFLALIIMATSIAQAEYYQAPVNSMKLKPISVLTEKGTDTVLANTFPKNKNIILVPAYFSCNSTCPLLAENLGSAVLRSKVAADSAVVFLSFNPGDDLASMKMFRDHHHLPPDWTLEVAKSESAAKDFLEQFGYQFQKTKDGFDHPNSAFVISKTKSLWTGILAGVANTPDEIDRAIGEANYSDLNGPSQKLMQYLSKPEYLILIGFLGVVLPLLIIIFVLFRRNRKFIQELNA